MSSPKKTKHFFQVLSSEFTIVECLKGKDWLYILYFLLNKSQSFRNCKTRCISITRVITVIRTKQTLCKALHQLRSTNYRNLDDINTKKYTPLIDWFRLQFLSLILFQVSVFNKNKFSSLNVCDFNTLKIYPEKKPKFIEWIYSMGARQRKAAKNISLYNTYPFPPTQNIQPKVFVQSGVYVSVKGRMF